MRHMAWKLGDTSANPGTALTQQAMALSLQASVSSSGLQEATQCSLPFAWPVWGNLSSVQSLTNSRGDRLGKESRFHLYSS